MFSKKQFLLFEENGYVKSGFWFSKTQNKCSLRIDSTPFKRINRISFLLSFDIVSHTCLLESRLRVPEDDSNYNYDRMKKVIKNMDLTAGVINTFLQEDSGFKIERDYSFATIMCSKCSYRIVSMKTLEHYTFNFRSMDEHSDKIEKTNVYSLANKHEEECIYV